MGALALPGFSVPEAPQEKVGALNVDCWKVPKKLSPEGSVRVPCLGGLSPGRILELAAMAGTGSVEFLDRGWCSTCTAGSSAVHPIQTSLEQARSLLDAACLATDRLPGLRNDYLPA